MRKTNHRLVCEYIAKLEKALEVSNTVIGYTEGNDADFLAHKTECYLFVGAHAEALRPWSNNAQRVLEGFPERDARLRFIATRPQRARIKERIESNGNS